MFFCLVFAVSLCASIYMCLVVTCWDGAGLLALVAVALLLLLLLTFVYCSSHCGVCNCSMFNCKLLYVHSSIAIILIGK